MTKRVVFFFILILLPTVYATALEGPVRINGFLSQGYLQSDENRFMYADTKNGTFEFNEVGLTFTTDLTDGLRLGMQLLARDLGSLGNDNVTIDWALGDYQYRNWFGLRVGKLKKPQGFFNQSRDVDAARTFIFLPSSVYNETFRDAVLSVKGVGIYGTLFGNLEYQMTCGVSDIPVDSGVVRRIDDSFIGSTFGQAVATQVDTTPTVNFIWYTPVEGLRLGATYNTFDFTVTTSGVSAGPGSDIEIKGHRVIGSIQHSWENLVLTGEYIGGVDSIRNQTLNTDYPDVDREGYYGMATWRFSEQFELGSYHSVWYPNTDDKGSYNFHKDTALSARFDLNDFWILKCELHHIKGVAEVDADTKDVSDTSYLFAAKITFTF